MISKIIFFIFSKVQLSWLKIAHDNDFWINLTCFEDLNDIIKYYKENKGSPKNTFKI